MKISPRTKLVIALVQPPKDWKGPRRVSGIQHVLRGGRAERPFHPLLNPPVEVLKRSGRAPRPMPFAFWAAPWPQALTPKRCGLHSRAARAIQRPTMLSPARLVEVELPPEPQNARQARRAAAGFNKALQRTAAPLFRSDVRRNLDARFTSHLASRRLSLSFCR